MIKRIIQWNREYMLNSTNQNSRLAASNKSHVHNYYLITKSHVWMSFFESFECLHLYAQLFWGQCPHRQVWNAIPRCNLFIYYSCLVTKTVFRPALVANVSICKRPTCKWRNQDHLCHCITREASCASNLVVVATNLLSLINNRVEEMLFRTRLNSRAF